MTTLPPSRSQALTCEQWLTYFAREVAPRHQWEVNHQGRIRTVTIPPRRCCCPLTAETERSAFWCHDAATAYGLSKVIADAIIDAADMTGNWPATGIRQRLLVACGLKERTHDV